MTSRRTVLRSAAAAVFGATAGLGGGCGGPRPVQVAVVWSDTELQRFEEVLDAYPHGRVEVLPVSDNIDAFLRARQRTGLLPDVAVLSRPGLVVEYARRGLLSKLDRLGNRFEDAWSNLLRHDGGLYGIWIKAAHKSLLWYRAPDSPDRESPARPELEFPAWPDLARFVRNQAARHQRSGPAPLALGAADGWVLTDWFENLLAATASDVYDALARGEPRWHDAAVRETLTRLAEIWSRPGAFPGGGDRALLTQFAESVIQVVEGRAVLTAGADFVAGVAGERPLAASRFPPLRPGGVQPLVAGGDAAVVLGGSAAGEALVEWLTEPGTFRPWIRKGGYLSPLRGVTTAEYPKPERRLAEELAAAADLRFDLSDRLPGAFTGADGVGIWRILQQFFADVAVTRVEVESAVDTATERLADAAAAASEQGGGW